MASTFAEYNIQHGFRFPPCPMLEFFCSVFFVLLGRQSSVPKNPL